VGIERGGRGAVVATTADGECLDMVGTEEAGEGSDVGVGGDGLMGVVFVAKINGFFGTIGEVCVVNSRW